MIVDVYYNRTRKCWSIRHKGRVIDHVSRLALRDATMRVSEAARLRVIRTGKRGVHAWIAGTLIGDIPPVRDTEEIGYSPFRARCFESKATRRPVTRAEVVLFQPDGRCFALDALRP